MTFTKEDLIFLYKKWSELTGRIMKSKFSGDGKDNLKMSRLQLERYRTETHINMVERHINMCSQK